MFYRYVEFDESNTRSSYLFQLLSACTYNKFNHLDMIWKVLKNKKKILIISFLLYVYRYCTYKRRNVFMYALETQITNKLGSSLQFWNQYFINRSWKHIVFGFLVVSLSLCHIKSIFVALRYYKIAVCFVFASYFHSFMSYNIYFFLSSNIV